MAGGVWHPVDLPEGYHTAARGRSFAMSAADCVEVWPPGRRAVGLRQVDGMPHQLGHEGELRDNRAAHEHRSTDAHGRRDRADQCVSTHPGTTMIASGRRGRPRPLAGRSPGWLVGDAVIRPVDINADHNPDVAELDERERRRTADQYANALRPTCAAP